MATAWVRTPPRAAAQVRAAQGWRTSSRQRPLRPTSVAGAAPDGDAAARGEVPDSEPTACAASDGEAAASSATATNDSQNPGCNSAQGSNTATAAAAASRIRCSGQRRPALDSQTKAAIIATVRCAGTPQPASKA